MSDTRHTQLIRLLAYTDQALANAEDIASDREDELRESALDFLIEFQESRRNVEAELRNK
jgi:hypothetical protein